MKIYGIHRDKIFALTAPNVPEVEDIITPLVPTDVVPFGSDNLFPDALIELKRNSSVHGAIIHSKKVFVTGKELISDDKKIETLIAQANGGETLRDVVGKIAYDLILYGNALIEIVRVKGGGVAFFHRDFCHFRRSKKTPEMIYNPKWSQRSRGRDVKYPLYPVFADIEGASRSLIHIKAYEPGQRTYGLPDYLAGMNAASILYKTDKWNLSRLDNSFKPSGLLLVQGEMSETERQQFEADWNAKFTGEEKQGQVMKLVNDQVTEKTKFIPFNDAYDADWQNQQRISEGNVITAHSWFRSLAGLSDNTGFDTQRILQEYEIALSTIIHDYQQMILSPIKLVIRAEMGIKEVKLSIVNKPPVTMASVVRVNNILRIWEGRMLIGMDYDETDPTQQNYINDNVNRSPGNSPEQP